MPAEPGKLQLTFTPVQASLQHTPSAQLPEVHCEESPQSAPSGAGVLVAVEVGVTVGVNVGVSVGVMVGVNVGVSVGVVVGVNVGVSVGVDVGDAVATGAEARDLAMIADLSPSCGLSHTTTRLPTASSGFAWLPVVWALT